MNANDAYPQGKTIRDLVRLSRRAAFMLGLILVLALAVRVAAALSRGLIQMDETAYLTIAENLGEGRGPVGILGQTNTYFSMLLPLLIGGLGRLFGDYLISAYAVVVIFGVLTLVPLFYLARELAGEAAAVRAAALAACLPLFIDYSSRIYSEGLYTFFLLLAVLLSWWMMKHVRLALALAAGAALGFAYLANPSALFYAAILPLLSLIVLRRNSGMKKAVQATAVFLAAFALMAAPFVFFLHSELGRWTYSGKYADVNLYDAAHNLRLGTIEWERDLLSLTEDSSEVKVNTLGTDTDLLGFVSGHPRLAARIFFSQSEVLYSELLPRILPLWLLPLLGLGLCGGWWKRGRAQAAAFLMILMLPALLVLAMYAHDRFFIPYVYLILIVMGAGWLRLESWGTETLSLTVSEARARQLRRWVAPIIALAVIMPSLAFAVVTVARATEPVQYREAGEWIAAQGEEGKRIMNRESPSAYYARGTPVFLPYAAYGPTVEYARNQRVDYLVVARGVIGSWRPGLEPLTREGAAHPEWKLVHTIRPGTAEETLVFEFTQTREG